MRRGAIGMVAVLFISLLAPAFSATPPKAGEKCTTFNKKQIYKNYQFTCIRKSGKLVWSKGVVIKKESTPTSSPTPSPMPTTSPTPLASPSPSESPSPTVAPTPTPTPKNTNQEINFETPCAKDPLVPTEWQAMEAYMHSIGACSAALRIVEKTLPADRPLSEISAKDQLSDVQSCKLINRKGNQSYLGFPDPSDKSSVNDFLARRHPSSDTTFQVIPISGIDAPARDTTPLQDYKKYFDYVKAWIDYNSDFGSQVEFRVPSKYFNVPLKIGEYQVLHSPENREFAQTKRRELMTEVMKVVDKEIDFRGADFSILLVPAGTSIDVIQQAPMGWVMTDEGPLNFITAVAPDTTTLGKNRPFANLNHPIWWLHEFYHVGLGLDDHYGDQTWNYGRHGTGMWTLMSTGQTELSTWEKWLVGLLQDSQVRCAKSTQSSIHWLVPTTYKSQKEKLLVVPISATKAIVVESMRIGGLNYKIPAESEGALVFVLDMTQTEHGFGMELKLPDSRNQKSQASRKSFFMSNAPFKLNESIVIDGIKVSIVESGTFGDVVKVERA
jgi:hypothetical protein